MTVSRHQAVGAYRRWEPPEFDAGRRPRMEAEPIPAPEPEPPPEPAIKLPTADDIEAMFEQARAEGLATGREEGLAAGREEGYAAGRAEGAAQSRDEAARLAGLANALDEALGRLDQDVAEEVVALAVEVARQMVQRAFAGQPAVVADTVRAALQQLPQNHVRIHLNPADAALAREHLADQVEHGQHRIVEDPAVTPGGCRLEGSGSQVDASVETRWRRILEGLGRTDTRWREEE